MTTEPGPGCDRRRGGSDDEIISSLREIAGLLRGLAENGVFLANPPDRSGGSQHPEIPHNPADSTRDSTPRTLAPAVPLTRREQQVLDILITGASNRKISRELGIAERTVKNNLQAIYRKLGVSGRAEAIARTLSDAS
ncbi:LuxR C-terminal-related transcriptional regulator [Streptomyces griseoviridis]|uniref:helix-turn-helix transcriptional regulator n=1 Tax=Streptomyces griseoviridis TaxID=45398 RepID=UPI0033EAF3FE